MGMQKMIEMLESSDWGWVSLWGCVCVWGVSSGFGRSAAELVDL